MVKSGIGERREPESHVNPAALSETRAPDFEPKKLKAYRWMERRVAGSGQPVRVTRVDLIKITGEKSGGTT